jgi:NAD+ synthase (glutamine-hydrolysing)
VIGLSGGIDSAVSIALLVEALGPKRVLAVNMPSEFNSATTKSFAAQCAANLGIEYKVVPIQPLYDAHLAMLAAAGYANPQMLVKENVQARIRGASVLAAIAAAEGGIFVCNGNKTEVALNYFTMYGDGAGYAAFLADLWKGEVYQLARYINEQAGTDTIPQGIIDLIPSAELSAEQNVDEGKGDPIFYPYHDQLLKAWIEKGWTPETVLRHTLARDIDVQLGCAVGTVHKYFPSARSFVDNLEWAWRNYTYEGKRVQLPPGALLSRRAFGYDRRDTIAPGFYTDEYRILKKKVLSEAW